MKSTVAKRSVIIAGQKTSVSLEDAFCEGLKDTARAQRQTMTDLVTSIDTQRKQGNLSSALRMFVLADYQKRASSTFDNLVHGPGEYTTVQTARGH